MPGIPVPPLEGPHAMRIKTEPAQRGDPGILLAQRPRGSITGIGENSTPFSLGLAVQACKIIEFHEHFTPDLHHFRDLCSCARQLPGDRRYSTHIHGDIFADNTVAAGQPLVQYPVPVNEVQRKAVDLDLACHRKRFPLRPFQIPADTLIPLFQLAERKHIIQAHHP